MQSKLSVDMFRPVRSARAYGARRKCCGPSSSAGASRRLRFARAEPEQPDARSESSAKRTMAGLDALLGIDEEEEKRKQVRFGQSRAASPGPLPQSQHNTVRGIACVC